MKELLWSFHTIREIKVQGFIILSRSGSTFLRSRALSTLLVCSIVLPLTFVNFTNWGIRLIPVGHLKLTHFTVIQRRLDYYCHIFVVTCLVFIPFANGQWFSTQPSQIVCFFFQTNDHLLYFDLGFWIKSFKKFQSFTVSMETGSAPCFWHNILLSFQTGPWFCYM